PQDLPTIISDAATKYGVDLALVNEVIKHESNNDSMAVSNKNARGLMQLRPITAKQYGVTDINDPEQNIDAGVHYLSDLIKRYKGNVRLALAAYNAGPDAVSNYNGVPPFKETRNYVNRIMKKAGNK
ncbi:MAG: lytic transglycosylase domain-containing protein, partial [Candidatus Dormibacteria bacterium]